MPENIPEGLDTEYPLRSALQMENGRNIYIDYMVSNEYERNIDDGYTDEENSILYGLQFDEAQAHQLLDKNILTHEVYNLVLDGSNQKKKEINEARHKRRQNTIDIKFKPETSEDQ